MSFYSNHKNLLLFTFFLFFYVLVAVYFIIDAPEEVGWDYYSWINIANKYADGHFKEAINAYWSPLMIWLMIPLIKLNLFDHKEVLAINFIAGIFLIMLAFKIAKQYLLTGIYKFIFILAFFFFSISIQVLYYDFVDFLSAVCLLAYIFFVSDKKMRVSKKYFILTSLTAILCVFGKSFYTYFVFLHLLVMLVYYLIMNRGKIDILIGNIIKTFLLVVLAISIWSSLLNWKYAKFMLSSSGKYNFTMITPTGIGEHFGTKHGLFPPPDSYSYHHWVDATYYPIEERSIFKDSSSFRYNWSILKYNLKVLLYTFSYISYFKWLVLFFIFFIFFIKNKLIKENLIIYFLSSLVIMCGYTLILIEERYFCGVQLLLFVAVFISVFEYLRQQNKGYIVKLVAVFIVFISFTKFAYFSFDTWKHRDKKTVENILEYENKIAHLPFMKNKKIATEYTHNGIGDLTCFEIFRKTNSQNYGSVGKYDDEKKQFEDLRKFEIDYFLYYGCSKVDKGNSCISRDLPFYIKDKTPVYVDQKYGVSIYSMKP